MKSRVYILNHRRTPIGSIHGVLSSKTSVELGIVATRALMTDIPEDLYTGIKEICYGQVISSGQGQAPARQIVYGAGLPLEVEASSINKVCASGLKAISTGALSLMYGSGGLVLCGGMESMSGIPYYLEGYRRGVGAGHQMVTDGLIQDGLWDSLNNFHMGNAAEITIRELGITREDQDEIALRSFRLTREAYRKGYIQKEITGVVVNKEDGCRTITEDEEISKFKSAAVHGLKPSFEQEGTITAASASGLADGACTVLLGEEVFVKRNGLAPMAEIIDFADAAQASEYFTTSPTLAIRKVLKNQKLEIGDIDVFEINESFASVIVANSRLLKIDPELINIWGGALVLGHPLGMSGARIVGRLLSILIQKDLELGIAAICNGGGGATAMLIRRI
ncbi:thiolase family protein [Zunongwangia sp. F363]|uniref:Thiolase family protein n=1 Tax=Autumnicola tepida TaxID=3075595 RepID=A0ABU3CEN5_9FLAO|nr:thiolase family protein [Zunongwangia sp. F363]MDT0644822.1 thiolase family protein [Zunongwangia sp. F363]